MRTEPLPVEDRHTPGYEAKWVGGWTAPIFVTVATLAWCLLIYLLIGSARQRNWQYGTVPYVPGYKPYNSERVSNTLYPKPQVVLPDETAGGTGGTR